VRALQHMIDCAAFSPSGVTSYGFTESVDAFSVGNVGHMICWSTIGGSVYDPELSRVSDTVDVAVLPADEGQTPRAVRGGWGLGIPENLPQERKDVAWHLLTYLTSQEFEQYQVLTYKTDPNRSSTFEVPELVEALPYLPVAGEAAQSAQILETALIPENFELVGEAAREFNLALAGSQTAEEACANAQDSWVAILQRAGHLA
jgi:multiple sugar transport system substrate-binding protein